MTEACCSLTIVALTILQIMVPQDTLFSALWYWHVCRSSSGAAVEGCMSRVTGEAVWRCAIKPGPWPYSEARRRCASLACASRRWPTPQPSAKASHAGIECPGAEQAPQGMPLAYPLPSTKADFALTFHSTHTCVTSSQTRSVHW
jgi:hypothetical protein